MWRGVCDVKRCVGEGGRGLTRRGAATLAELFCVEPKAKPSRSCSTDPAIVLSGPLNSVATNSFVVRSVAACGRSDTSADSGSRFLALRRRAGCGSPPVPKPCRPRMCP